MSVKWPNKDPDEKYSFGIKWSSRITATILTSTWTVVNPPEDDTLVLSNEDFDDETKQTQVVVAGGILGHTYEILNHVTSDDLVTFHFEETAKLKIASR